MSTDDQLFELYKIAFTAAINDQTQGQLDQDAVVATAEALTSRAAKGFERVRALARSPSERVHSEHAETVPPPPAPQGSNVCKFEDDFGRCVQPRCSYFDYCAQHQVLAQAKRDGR